MEVFLLTLAAIVGVTIALLMLRQMKAKCPGCGCRSFTQLSSDPDSAIEGMEGLHRDIVLLRCNKCGKGSRFLRTSCMTPDGWNQLPDELLPEARS